MPTGDRDRSQQLSRVIELVRRLSGSPQTVVELADSTGVQIRTIRRDMLLLEQVGIVVDVVGDEPGERQRHRINTKSQHPLIHIAMRARRITTWHSGDRARRRRR